MSNKILPPAVEHDIKNASFLQLLLMFAIAPTILFIVVYAYIIWDLLRRLGTLLFVTMVFLVRLPAAIVRHNANTPTNPRKPPRL